MNTLTKSITFAIETLFLRQPMRTSLGFVFGMGTRIITKILSIWVVALDAILVKVNLWEFGLLGICFAHISTIRNYYSGHVNYLSESEEKAFAMIRELKLPEHQKQLLYLKVVEKVLERVELKPEIKNEQREIEKLFGR